MKDINHERAKRLIVEATIEQIAARDREWLDRHLAACLECSSEAGALTSAVKSLRSQPVAASPEVVRRTRLAVRSRAEQLNAARARSVSLWISATMSIVWMILTAPYVWQTFAWLGDIAHMPAAVWQIGFLMWWFLPATVLAAAAAWRHTAKHDVSNWISETNWGQL